MNKEINSVPEGRFAPEDWEYILLQMVNDRSGIDFGMYRMPTFRRRYIKRMNLSDARDLRDYVKLLEDNPEQLDLLVTDLLIGVTSFFRDPQAFRVLDEKAVQPLFQREDNSGIRCWVAGCSNGMEAYSIAMLMQSAVERYGGGYTIFATDISDSALKSASRGIYTEKQFNTVPDQFRKYFGPVEKGWRISRDIRARMVFSHHDILSDPPFAHIDLVSCRNMMIYLKNRAQDIVLGRLNYSLSLGGFLFLGSGETPGRNQDNLESVDLRWRLFRKVSDTVISVDMFPFEKHSSDSFSTLVNPAYSPEDQDEFSARSRTFTSCLEERFFPDCVFIDEDYRILFINGDMNSYLSIPAGIPGGSLLPMLPGPLKSAVRAGVRRARGSFRRIQCDTRENVTIFVSCISPLEMSGVFLLEFVRDPEEAMAGESRIQCSESDISILEEQIALLESDLATTRRELRSRTGELQASNEELQTTNEEIRSANEELTASNEELIASNEELQRLNRKLTILTDDMQNLLESMDVGSLFLDNGLCIRRFNPSVCSFFKITPGDVGRIITDFTTTLERDCLQKLITLAGEAVGSGGTFELALEADLSGNWLAKISPYKTSSGRVEGTVITFIDVTELREGERSLARSERKFRGLFNGFPIGALLVFLGEGSEEFTILDMNPRFRTLLEDNPGLAENADFKRGILEKQPEFEFTSGKRDFMCEVFRPVDFAETVCVTIRDVSESRRAGQKRQELEKRLHDAQILAGIGIWEFRGDERTVTLSPEAAELFGLQPGSPLPFQYFKERIEDFDDFYRRALEAVSKGHTYTGMVRVTGDENSPSGYYKVSCYGTGESSPANVYGYALDITQEIIGHQILENARDELAETQRLARIGVIEMQWDENFRLHRENFLPSAMEVLKLREGAQDDFFAKHLDAELAASILRKLRNCAHTGEEFSLDLPIRNGVGQKIYVQLMAKPRLSGNEPRVITIVIVDVTRRHQLENELKHSEKLRSVGELAGGIAHDFNNQLMGIVGFAECLGNRTDSPEEQEYIRGILQSSERAGALVRQLLAFSRKGLSHMAPFDLHHLIDEVISLLKRSIDRRIDIRRSFRADNALILGDASEMNNAMLNLALNARDAIDGRGTMTFATEAGENGMIVFTLSDTGRGIEPEIMEKVFEPFFTTKPIGDGTGMGLSAVYGTVQAHNGTITIDSTPGEGTTVTITLPLSCGGAEPGPGDCPSAAGTMEGTVLLVDDEETVRTVLSNLLVSLGLTVLTASDGLQAAEIHREKHEEIKLVLMDMTMPRMNGMDSFLRMKDTDPGVRVVILSGHSAESTSNEMLKLGIKRVLQKPVRLSVLSETIREIISR